jgi:hypothetical protein
VYGGMGKELTWSPKGEKSSEKSQEKDVEKWWTRGLVMTTAGK